MGHRFKRGALCLLTVSMLAMTGNVYAGTETPELADAETEVTESFWSTSYRTEPEENVSVSFGDITKYLKKAGSADGYDIYLKDKDTESRIWEENGGKPAKKSDYTPQQEELAKTIGEIKSLGEFTAVDPVKKSVAATFKDSKKSGSNKSERIYVSEACRYLLYTDEDKSRMLRVRELVSAIDDPFIFRSSDGNLLERMDSSYGKVLETYKKSYPKDADDQGKLVYRSSDGKAFSWLTEDGTSVIGTFRECAENQLYTLLVDDRLGTLGLKCKSNGYIWWSSPLGASRDPNATPIIADELRSSSVLRYGKPKKRSDNNYLRSGNSECSITVNDINGGVRVKYDFSAAGFSYPIEYTLEDDHLKASVKVSEIKESVEGNVATELTVLGAFGAASDQENGYFVIPDGSGALIRFNNQRTTKSNAYDRRIYGEDITAVPTSRGAVMEQIYLPVYGIVKEDSALLAVAASGDSNARLSAHISGQSNSSYNLCGFTFILRDTDIFYMSGGIGDKITVFESGDIKSDDIEMLYFPIFTEDPDYTDIAGRYRQYLMDKGMVQKTSPGTAPLYLDIYGGVQKKKPVAGIPVTMKQSVTSFPETREILSQLSFGGVKDAVVSYDNWTDDGICTKVDSSASPSGTLGGRAGFRELTNFMDDKGFLLYPSADNREYSSGNGYNAFSGSAVRISGAYARIVSYDRAYGIPDGFRKNMSLLSPVNYPEVYGKAGDNYAKAGLSGISVGRFASTLYGDYGKQNVSRGKAMELEKESLASLSERLENGVLSRAANAYALPYLSHLTAVPLTSSRFDIFDEDIPFYQLVLHGMIPMSTRPVNGTADPDDLLLMAAASGTMPGYGLTAAEAGDLKDTEYDVLYYAGADGCLESITEDYKLLRPLLADVSDSFITDYETKGDLIYTRYSNGTEVWTDTRKKTVEYNGNIIDLSRKE